MPRSGRDCCGSNKDLIDLRETATCVSRFEVCKTSKVPERERVYSFRLYEKNGEYTRGLRTSGLRERFKSPVEPLFLIDFPAFDK